MRASFLSGRAATVGFVMLLTSSAAAQVVVNSTFTADFGSYRNPDNWSPAEVPNNSAARHYNVTVASTYGVQVDIDATVSNLILHGTESGNIGILDRRFTVAGTTLNLGMRVFVRGNSNRAGTFSAGTLSSFSEGTLSSTYELVGEGNWATLQFNNANITTLAGATLVLQGQLTRIVDENGNDALLNLSRIESDARFHLFGRNFALAGALTNNGTLLVGGTPMIFTATTLTNFHPGNHTLSGGVFAVGEHGGANGLIALRFGGADVVNNASVIEITGQTTQVTDLAGLDAFRNFAHNLPQGVFSLNAHDFAAAGNFTNDGTLAIQECQFVVGGSLTNFDPITRTLTGGTYNLFGYGSSELRFKGADIVHNGASISVFGHGAIRDISGKNGLRNFADNLSTGTFRIEFNTDFRTSGDFTNAGVVELPFASLIPEYRPGTFTVPRGFRYRQTAGRTYNQGTLRADVVELEGGVLSLASRARVVGDVAVGAGSFHASFATVQGDLTLSDGSSLRAAETTVSGSVHLAGQLVIGTGGFPASNDTFTVLTSGGRLTGTFNNVASGGRLTTSDGNGSFIVTYAGHRIVLSNFQARPIPAQLLNISTRSEVSVGERVMICGFIVSGADPKKVIVRGLGPSQGTTGPWIDDPQIRLHGADGRLIASNNDWKQTQEAQIKATGVAPRDDREAAIVATLEPGTYTVVTESAQGFAGTALVEAYDLSPTKASKLVNLSTRGAVYNDNPLIGGIIAGGNGPGNAEIVVRAIGPSLKRAGITDAPLDPTIELRDRNGAIVAANDDWVSNREEFYNSSSAVYALLPDEDSESMLQLSLKAGEYTALVRTKGDSNGVALVEVYDLRR